MRKRQEYGQYSSPFLAQLAANLSDPNSPERESFWVNYDQPIPAQSHGPVQRHQQLNVQHKIVTLHQYHLEIK